MAQQALLRIGPGIDTAAVQWILLDGKNQGETNHGTLGQAAEAVRRATVTVILSGSDALLTDAVVPGRSRGRAQAAIPYMLEESLVEDVSAYHFVIGRPDRAGSYPVVVVLHTHMQRLLRELREAGIRPARIISEVELLDRDRWNVAIDGDVAVARLGPGRGFATEIDALPLLLAAANEELPAEDGAPRRVEIHGTSQELAELESFDVLQYPARDALFVLSRGAVHDALNLMQGDYGGSAQTTVRVLRNYRVTAALAALLLAVVAVGGVLEYRDIRAQNEQLQEQMSAVLKQAFPDLRRVVDPVKQMRQRLQALRKQGNGGGGFLELLHAAAEPLAGQKDAQLNSVLFRRGRLELDVEVGELRSLDALQQAIAKSGKYRVSIESAKSEQQTVRGRLRITRAGQSS